MGDLPVCKLCGCQPTRNPDGKLGHKRGSRCKLVSAVYFNDEEWQTLMSAPGGDAVQPAIQYSTDYDALWHFICAGHEALCFVDHRFMCAPRESKPWRDAAKVTRRGPYQINIGARGISYAGAYEFDAPQWPDEKELFVKICQNINLEWASPLQMRSVPTPIPTSERLPTEADADCFGNVWARLAVADRYDLHPLRFVMSCPEAFDYWQPTGLTRPAEPDGGVQHE